MDNLIFILSTGRTGTQFFESYLSDNVGKALCLHEPHPSRRFKFYSNKYLNGKISSDTIIRSFKKGRKNIFKKAGNNTYVESNNFMFGCIPALNEAYKDLKVIHIVRHPVSYVKSHLNHGFWKGHKKFFAKHVPYWIENVEIKNPSDPVELLAARWNYVNTQISLYQESNEYLFVRFEDLFSKKKQDSSEVLNRIRSFCGLPELSVEENSKWLAQPKNFSTKKHQLTEVEKKLVLDQCRELIEKYKY